MPNIPDPFKIRDWRKVARDYDRLVFDFTAEGEFFPLIWLDRAHRNFEQDTFGLYTVLGDPRMGPDNNNGEAHEGINAIAAVLSATLVGIDKSSQGGNNFVQMCENYFNSGRSIVMNCTSDESGNGCGGYGRSFWYDLLPNILFFGLAHFHPRIHKLEAIMHSAADSWSEANKIMNGNYHHTYFNFRRMEPVDNGRWKEPDAPAGITWLEYMAYAKFRELKYLQAAETAMEALEEEKDNPFYEVLLPFGAYTAARMNTELGKSYNVQKILNWCFDGDSRCRSGWGVVSDRWGKYDTHGLQGSIDNKGGYAFAMNTFDMAMPLVPLVRYDPGFARAVGKWMLNAANAARLFYPGELPCEHQACPEYMELTNNVIAYEGLRKVCPEALPEKEISPFAQGDARNWGTNFPGAACLSLYGSSHAGVFGGIISRTNDEKILQIDCLKTDFFREKAYPTFLYFNPYTEVREVRIDVGPNPVHLYDTVSQSLLAKNVNGKTSFALQGDSASVIVLLPANKRIHMDKGRVMVDGIFVSCAG